SITELLSDRSKGENWILFLETFVQEYMSANKLKNILIWLDEITANFHNTVNLNASKAAALFIFLAFSIACEFKHNFQRTKHLIIDFLLLEDSDLAGLIDYTLCFIIDIADDLEISLVCAEAISKSSFLKRQV
ncbi:MAG: hypothetical protein VKL59_18510, partial [Nostocaceae cyanobacterium]|nr:hypothetical protein [Nostocaceae cyanobacterium]